MMIHAAGGIGPIWARSDGTDTQAASRDCIVVGTLVLIVLALALALLLALPTTTEEEEDMPVLNKTAESPEDKLPFPGKLVEGRYDVQYLHLKQNKKTLVGWCREFRLPISGTVPALTARLIDFSADREKWEDHLATGARRQHRGPRTGGKKSLVKQSYQRREKLFNTAVPNGNVASHALPTEASRDHRTQEEIDAVLPWAARIVAKYPYRPPQPEADAACISAAPPAPCTITKLLPPAPLELQDIHSKLDTLLLRIPSDIQIPTPCPYSGQPYAAIAAPPPPLYTLPSSTTTPQALPSDSRSISLAVPTNTHQFECLPAASDKTAVTRTLLLGNGHSITFTAQDVPPPPTTTFTDNIPRLNSMWDDTSVYWEQDSVLKILGHPIALVYWPLVYTRWRSGDWDTLKTQFGHWKAVVERYREGTKEEFWAEFRDAKGRYLSFTAIVSCLKGERVEENERIAKRARLEYGDAFASVFSYRKGSFHTTMTDPTRIANKYRSLHS